MTDEKLAALLTALGKIPPTVALVFHGVTEPDALPGTFGTRGITATSYDSRIATENGATAAVAAIVVKEGRPIAPLSRHPLEREVVLLPGALLRRLATTEARDGSRVVLLEQLSPTPLPAGFPDTLESLAGAAVALIAQQKAEGAVEITSPGKFSSPLD